MKTNKKNMIEVDEYNEDKNDVGKNEMEFFEVHHQIAIGNKTNKEFMKTKNKKISISKLESIFLTKK